MKRTYDDYLKLIGLVVLLFYPFLEIRSQNDCSEILKEAEILFDQGIIEKIPELLEDCIGNGLSSQERVRARRLIIMAFLFDNNLADAEKSMAALLRDSPGYQIQPDDPSEFTTLFSTFRTFPFLSLGIFAGANLSSATMTEHYGPYNTTLSEGHFSITGPEYQIGVGANIFLTDRFELNMESVYTRTSFAYSNMQYGFAQIDREETLQRLEFPVSLTFDITGVNLKPYLRIGASYGYIISATSDYVRSYTSTGSSLFEPVEESGVDIRNYRNASTVNAVIGSGIKYRIGRGYLVFDLRYFYGLSNLVNPGNRWEQGTVFSHYHADGDFHVDYFAFSLGFRYSFYKSKKI
jgi:hypothetical protein